MGQYLLLSGFWHGANWTFIAWGAYHAFLFLPLILLGKNRKHTDIVAAGRVLPTFKEAGQMLLTFFLAVIGWIIFRAESIGQAWEYVCGVFSQSLFSVPIMIVGLKKTLFFTAVMLIAEWFSRQKDFALQFGKQTPAWLKITVCYVVIIVMLQFAAHSQSFIYFQF